MKKNNFAPFKNAPKPYVLTFINDTTFSLILDVNECQGHYQISKPGHIAFDERTSCSYVCCDSDFAKKLSAALHKMNRYYSQGDQLIFKGEGSVVFKAK